MLGMEGDRAAVKRMKLMQREIAVASGPRAAFVRVHRGQAPSICPLEFVEAAIRRHFQHAIQLFEVGLHVDRPRKAVQARSLPFSVRRVPPSRDKPL